MSTNPNRMAKLKLYITLALLTFAVIGLSVMGTRTLLDPGRLDLFTDFVRVDNSGHVDPNKEGVTNRWMWTPEKAAHACIRAIHKRKREFTFTFVGRVWCWMGAHTPGLLHYLVTRMGMPGSETLYSD